MSDSDSALDWYDREGGDLCGESAILMSKEPARRTEVASERVRLPMFGRVTEEASGVPRGSAFLRAAAFALAVC